jgi:hypothetical protein
VCNQVGSSTQIALYSEYTLALASAERVAEGGPEFNMSPVLTKDTEVWVPCVNIEQQEDGNKSSSKKTKKKKKKKPDNKSTFADMEVAELAAVDSGNWERGLVLATPKLLPKSSREGSSHHQRPCRVFVKTVSTRVWLLMLVYYCCYCRLQPERHASFVGSMGSSVYLLFNTLPQAVMSS